MSEFDPMPTYDSLQHVFLIAMPQMSDPIFAQSVIYLWECTEYGARGAIINKKIANTCLGDLFKQLKLQTIDPTASNLPVYHGGPVSADQGFIIRRQHQVEDFTGKPLVEITVSSSRNDLVELANGQGVEDALVIVGCTHWDGGQLDDEIAKNHWLIVPFSEHTLFSEDRSSLETDRSAENWLKAAARAGIDLSRVSAGGNA